MILKKYSTAFMAVCIITSIFTGSAFAEKIAIVVNKKNVEKINKVTLKRIFLKEYRIWNFGKEVVPLDLSKSGLKAQFAKSVIGKNLNDLKMYWIQKRITDSLRPPLNLRTAEQVKKLVGKTVNAIGYIPASAVDDSVRVVLEID